MKKCQSCPMVYEGGCGLRCELDGMLVEYNTKCVFKEWFEEKKDVASKLGYELQFRKVK